MACFIAKHEPIYCKIIIRMAGKYLPRWMPSRLAWDESIYLRRTQRHIAEKQGTWKEPILKIFADSMNRRQAKFQERGWTGENEL